MNAKSGDATLGQALKEFCSVDHLTKNNKYLCPKCKSKQNATKRTSINQAPRILIFTIKRFDIFGRKIQAKIRYPVTFDAKAHMDQAVDGKVPLQSLPDQIYDLYGVVVHQGGSTSSGHYYSYCRTDMALSPNSGDGKPAPGKWFECNDSYISPISEHQALNAQAYLLFYQKRVVSAKTASSKIKQVPESDSD